MSEHGSFGLKPDLRLEWRGQGGHDETQKPDHSVSLGDSVTSSTRIEFSVHTTVRPRGGCWLLRWCSMGRIASRRPRPAAWIARPCGTGCIATMLRACAACTM